MRRLPTLNIGGVDIALPIIQEGMGVAVSTDTLASAVSNEGGLGVIASVGLGEGIGESDARSNYVESNKRALGKLIRRAREKTSNPLGVNIMIALTDWQHLAKKASDDGIDFIIASTALPLSLPEYVNHEKTKLIPKVSSERAIYLICKRWDSKYHMIPDAFIVEGPKSGGHQGFSFEELKNADSHLLEDIVKKAKEILKPVEKKYGKRVPIIAAGGIYDGRDIARMISSGADGVAMGSRFVCTYECDVADGFKQAYVDAKKEDIALIQSPVGLPARVINNEFYRRVIEKKAKIQFRCPYQCLKTCDPARSDFCIADALVAARRGRMEDALILCSTTTHRIRDIVSVKKLISQLLDDAVRYL